MTSAFLQLLNMSITAGWIVLAVLILRLCLKKAPRWITCLLWGLVALRLILPFQIESPFSLIPSAETVVQTESETPPPIEIDSGFTQIDKPLNNWLSSSTGNSSHKPSVPKPDTDLPTDTDGGDNTVSPPLMDSEESTQNVQSASFSIETVLHVASILWLVGVGVMLLYEILSAVLVRRRVLDAVLRRDNVWESDRIETPFIFGTFRPRIYVPYGLDEQSLDLIVAHERAHMHRLDHWLKPFAFTLLAVYWYNPLLWIAYFLLCKDIEVACDERVVRNLSAEDRRLYAAALLKCGSERRTLVGCPLAFGELSIRQRIFSIIGYRKPFLWVVIVSLVVCVLAALCLLTVPQSTVAQEVVGDIVQNATTGTTTTTTTVPSTSISTTHSTSTTRPTTRPPAVVKPTDANHSHFYGDWTIIVAPTCDKDGRRERVCSCGDTQVGTIVAVGHSYIRNVCVTCGDANGTGFIPDYRIGMANTVGNENGVYCIARQDQWLYFKSDHRRIAKCRVDGTGWTNVYSVQEGFVQNINVVGDWIYFFVNIEIGDAPYIAKVRTDGSEFSYVIKSVNVSEMLVVNDTLYFTTIRNPYFDYNNDCSPLYSMSLSGGMTKQIHDGFVSRLASNGSQLFFEHTPENGKKSLRRIDLSTMKRSAIIASYSGRQLLLKDNYLYFQETDDTTGEYVIRSYFTGVGLEPTTLGTMHGFAWFAVIRNCVYYYGGIPSGDEWWNGEVGVVEYYPRGNEYDVIYPCNDNIECIALGDCLVWLDFYSPVRIYDYDTSKWIEIHAP